MYLQLTDDQNLLKDTFGKLFRAESTSQRLREAKPLGFDPQLWAQLVELGAPAMRVPEASGGLGFSLLDCAVVVEEAGRYLASVPLVDVVVCARLLSEAGERGAGMLARLLDGSAKAALALTPFGDHPGQIVSQGAIADIVIGLAGSELVAIERTPPMVADAPGGGIPAASMTTAAETGRTVLATGDQAKGLYESGQEEWRLLTAAFLIGLQSRATQMAADYANERHAFGRPIGSFQGVSHPLANSAVETESARLLLWKAVWANATGHEAAQPLSALVWWSIAERIVQTVGQAMRTFGGYGLSIEYDVHLYHQRAVGLVLCGGTARAALDEAGERLFGNKQVTLPPPGNCPIDFNLPDYALELHRKVTALCDAEMTDEMRRKAHHSTASHNPEFLRKLAQAGVIYFGWPDDPEISRSAIKNFAVFDALEAQGYTTHLLTTTDWIGRMVFMFGSDEAKAEIIPRVRGGEVACSLGFSEPGSGSDVFAARTRAVRDGDDWIINGSKMWTTGGPYADYVFLLTRTDPEAVGPKGLTMFAVPTRIPGFSFQTVDTYQDERTSITFYADMRVPDTYRLGEVNGGLKIMSAALLLEHAAAASIFLGQVPMMKSALRWAKTSVNGVVPADRADVRAGIAKVFARFHISEAFGLWVLYQSEMGVHTRWGGPLSKLAVTEAHLASSWELRELIGPDALRVGRDDLGTLELSHRRAYGSTIYGGTSEIHRSLTAEQALGMAKSRG